MWSNIQAGLSMANCTKIIEAARQDFHRKWASLYDLCILRQHKWTKSNCTLQIGDIVLIRDLLDNKTHYPQLEKITHVDGSPARYFTVEYKIGKKVLSVQRTAQSLVLILTVAGTEGTLVDPLQFLKQSDLRTEQEQHSDPVPVRANRGTTQRFADFLT